MNRDHRVIELHDVGIGPPHKCVVVLKGAYGNYLYHSEKK